jgi:Holliday junction DNA helicase RuvA
MIATLSGVVAEKIEGGQIIVDVAGIGYGVQVTLEDATQLNTSKPAKLYIYEHIRENGHDLFGFTLLATKQLFELLLEVNGVGPKMALSIMSVGNADEVRQAIAEGDVKFLQAASGVGKRVAERIVVDLKDKVGLLASDQATTFLKTGSSDEAVQALINLGFSPQDASAALHGVERSLSTEERIKQALKGVAR